MPVVQPVQSARGDMHARTFLMWNGEAWKYDGQVLRSHDSSFIFQKLVEATDFGERGVLSTDSSKQNAISSVSGVFGKIAGPYAFILFDSIHNLLFFGRDVLGRRSLLIRRSKEDGLELASVSAGNVEYKEVSADGIYYIDLSSLSTKSTKSGPLHLEPFHIPWQRHDSGAGQFRYPFPDFNVSPSRPGGKLSLDSSEVKELTSLLKHSLQLRLNSAPAKASASKAGDRIAILFSGGLDCTLLARIADEFVPPDQEIDLLNVAFENPRVIDAAMKTNDGRHTTSSAYESCPDRVTGRASFEELCALCPGRTWHFVAIDIAFQELTGHRNTIIELLSPHNTEMDFSIGCALYFAARGAGTLRKDVDDDVRSYVTPAQVLISGLGADELFGGYSRHAMAFQRHGHQGLVDELRMDFERIAQRNLGRDDRIISHWGKEVRYPFLDEDVVAWALRVPADMKCDFGTGTDNQNGLQSSKRLLRFGAWEVGLRQAAQQKKRAIQFGARTAKMTAGNVKGTYQIGEAA